MKKISINQKDFKHQIDVTKILKILEPVDYPAPQEMEVERNKFISLISQNQAKTVSLPLVKRIKQMTRQVLNPRPLGYDNTRKERFVMSTALVRIILISSIIFSLTTGVFAFALTSLPDSPLYDAKLAMENASLRIMDDPAKLAIKHMTLAQNRVKEMVKQTQQGDVPDGGTLEQLQQHLVYALHYAAQVQGDGMGAIMVQAQNMAQNQIQTLSQVQTQAGGDAEGPIGMALQLMNQFMFQLQFGLGNPGEFKNQYQGQPDVANLEFKLLDCDCTPIGDENKYGQQSDGQGASPGQKYGNPDCDCCEPTGDEYKHGQTDTSADAEVKDTSQDCQDCVPAGDENKYGPQPDQPGPGGPGGNPDCTNCDPDGDQNQNGPQPPEPPGTGGPGGNPDCTNCDPDGDENQYGKN